MTFQEAAAHIQEHTLGERSENRISLNDIKEFIYWASLEIAQALGFPREAGVTAVAAGATTATLQSGVWRLDPTTVKLGSFPMRPASFDEVVMLQNRSTGVPTAFYWNPATFSGSTNTITFGSALEAAANLTYEFVAELYGGEKPAYLVTNETSDIWGTTLTGAIYDTPVFEEWHEATVIPHATAKCLNRMKLFNEAGVYHGLARNGVTSFAGFLGVPVPPSFAIGGAS